MSVLGNWTSQRYDSADLQRLQSHCEFLQVQTSRAALRLCEPSCAMEVASAYGCCAGEALQECAGIKRGCVRVVAAFALRGGVACVVGNAFCRAQPLSLGLLGRRGPLTTASEAVHSCSWGL
jgi:hypothetical protein